jgi:hypothetical protein
VPDLRRIVFGLLLLGLAGGLLWSLAETDRPSRADPAPPRLFRPAGAEAPVLTPARPTARRFLSAFLAEEVGDRSARVRKAIYDDAGGALARELLREPARVGTRPATVRLGAIKLHRLPGRPGLLLVSGTARRASGPEPFAFLFARRGRRWLALAPAE